MQKQKSNPSLKKQFINFKSLAVMLLLIEAGRTVKVQELATIVNKWERAKAY